MELIDTLDKNPSFEQEYSFRTSLQSLKNLNNNTEIYNKLNQLLSGMSEYQAQNRKIYITVVLENFVKEGNKFYDQCWREIHNSYSHPIEEGVQALQKSVEMHKSRYEQLYNSQYMVECAIRELGEVGLTLTEKEVEEAEEFFKRETKDSL